MCAGDVILCHFRLQANLDGDSENTSIKSDELLLQILDILIG